MRRQLPLLIAVLAAGLFLVTGTGRAQTTPTAGPATQEPAPAAYGFVYTPDARLYYEVYGEGEPLILLPGLSWNHRAREDEAVAYGREFRAIVFDARGTGDSSFPEGVDLSIALLADDAVALLDALGIDAAHVYGISEGGMVAQEMALRHPEKVRSLVLGATTPGGPQSIPPEQWALDILRGVTKGADPLLILEPLISPAYLAEHRAEVIARLLRTAAGPPTPARVTEAQMQAVEAHDAYDRLPDIAAPTLVLHGADDPLFPAENARILARRIPGAELVLFEGTRHSYAVEKSAEAGVVVRDFLRRHSAQASSDGEATAGESVVAEDDGGGWTWSYALAAGGAAVVAAAGLGGLAVRRGRGRRST